MTHFPHRDWPGRFLNQDMSGAQADWFRAHLPDCEACQTQLEELLQLEALEHSVVATGGRPLRLMTRARRRWFEAPGSWAMGGLVLAAVGLVIFRLLPASLHAGAGAFPDTGPRVLEARVALAAADRYRPYDVMLGGAAAQPAMNFEGFARLEAKGDNHGIAAALLVRKNWQQAEPYLARAAPSPAVDNDRAVVALEQDRPEAALPLLDHVLAGDPRHPQALWNRGLALAGLKLPLAAAASFDAVAALAEPGWSEEARRHAGSQRTEVLAEGRSWNQDRGTLLGEMLSGAPIAASVLRHHPGVARLFLYDAVRAAPSSARVLALLPLASALDGEFGGHVLEAYLQKTALQDFKQRGPLAQAYADLLAGHALDARAAGALLDRMRRAHQDDLLLGTLIQTDRATAFVDEFARLASGSGDPWFSALASREAARAATARGDLMDAERQLLAALPSCRRSRIDYRCAELESELAQLYATLHRPVEARQHALAGLELAHRGREWGLEVVLLQQLGEIARLRQDFSLTRAFLDEAMLHQPGHCGVERFVHTTLAAMHLAELDVPAARAEIQRAPRCNEPLDLLASRVLASLARHHGTPDEVSLARASLAAIRPKLSPAGKAMVDEAEGRLLLARDPTTAVALLRRAISTADGLPSWSATARKARSNAYSGLAVAAAGRGGYDDALALVAAELGTGLPSSCVVAVAVDDEQTAVAMRGADGATHGHFSAGGAGPHRDQAHVVPQDMKAALAACGSVALLAEPTLHGSPDLLPPEIAWSYRSPHPTRPSPGAQPALRLLVADVVPPAVLGLPHLAPWSGSDAGERTELRGAAATPTGVLDAMRDASEIEFHTHGLVDLGISDVSLLALSPDGNGNYALTAADVKKHPFTGAPLVILGACRAAEAAPYAHEAWSLPMAFIAAGASAVLASPENISDGEAGRFFAAVRRRIARGEPAVVALRDERVEWLKPNQHGWTERVLMFD